MFSEDRLLNWVGRLVVFGSVGITGLTGFISLGPLWAGFPTLDPVCKGRLRWRDSLTGGVLVAFQTVWLSWSLRCGRLRIVRWLVIMGRVRR